MIPTSDIGFDFTFLSTAPPFQTGRGVDHHPPIKKRPSLPDHTTTTNLDNTKTTAKPGTSMPTRHHHT